MAKEIRSENAFFFSFIKEILFLPFVFILFIFRRCKFKDVLRPFFNLFQFITEPKMTLFLILANIAMFIWSATISEKLFTSLLLFPKEIFQFHFLGLLTSGFLHASIGHLLGNMLALFIFGRVVERKLGSAKLGLIYLGALILSGLFTAVIHYQFMGDNTPGLGASGAIMGLISAAILLDPFYLTYELFFPLPLMIVGWLVILADILGILNPVEDGIGHFAHLGGFLSITLLVFFLNSAHKKEMKKGFLINLATLIVVIGIRFFF